MDKAIIGTCRIGYFRIGVTQPIFDLAIGQLEKIPSPKREQWIMDSAKEMIMDGDGNVRMNVYTLDWERLMKQLEKV